MPLRLAPLVVLAFAAACKGGAPTRTVTLFGVTVTTDIPQSLAVIVDAVDADGTRLQPCYAMLGQSAGRQLIGEPMPDGTKVRLRLGIDADLWHIDAAGKAKQVESKSLPGLSGANAGNGMLELRGALATRELDVEPGTSVSVGFEGGQIVTGTSR